MRQREALITEEYWLDVNQSTLKAITLLSDSLYPSKRIKDSPLLYGIPDFPM
jgi:hypothetical protein